MKNPSASERGEKKGHFRPMSKFMPQESIRCPGEGCSGLALYAMVQGGTEIVQSAEGGFLRMLLTPNIISHPHIQLNC